MGREWRSGPASGAGRVARARVRGEVAAGRGCPASARAVSCRATRTRRPLVFIEEYLEQLRRERFTPAAVARYVRRVAARSREAAIANPGAVRSVWLVALLYFGLAFA